ncbi:restriction endonuclease subunit S [Lactobacillus delbrueckii subsp. lactis]|uniref:restriction endonuclease subunit S n=1 Tax=Lactobacillus delbrueckii TaxID=1584 RepID=UPI001E2AF7CE|nr:restriction endonuclease subunit S [Lactobacillus delbrueckii]MCD5599460.1 restriction endonuclease subunit S [Lactobacillus delbrueckii subsp. lactis]
MRYKLSDCVTIISGGTPKKSQESYWNGNIPWITVKDFNGKYVSTTTDSITLEGLKHSSANLTEDQDILISARGTVGKVLMVGAGYTFNQSIYCLRADRSVLVPDYLFYWLEKNVSLVKQGTHGSVFETITKDTFDHLTIDLPDIEEQKKIAHKLSMFDRKINLNEQINDNLVV